MSDDIRKVLDAIGLKLQESAKAKGMQTDAFNAAIISGGWDEVEAKTAIIGGTTLSFYKGKLEDGTRHLVYALTLRGTPKQAILVAEALTDLHFKSVLNELGDLLKQANAQHDAPEHDPDCPSHRADPPSDVTRL